MVSSAPDTTSGPLSERWRELGRDTRVTLDSVELWSVELPFRQPVATAKGVHRSRPLVLVHLVGRSSDPDTVPGPTERATPAPAALVEGWGECAALADTTFDDEDVARSLGHLQRDLVPALVGQMSSERTLSGGGTLPGPSDLEGVRRAAPGAPLAFAALEMAVADAHLRAGQRSLAGLLGVEGRVVEPGAVVGTADSVDELVAAVGRLVELGYSRVKVKIGPGWDVEPVAAVARSFPELSVQVDANGSYRFADPLHREHLAGLDGFGLLCIEQPFGRAELDDHARLAARMSTPICLDESLDSPGRVEEAIAMGACSVVCVKPARLGGLGAALSVVERCRRSGIPLWMGGMFESGYARGVNTILGALDGMSWPGDLSPSRSYLADDLVPDGARPGPGRPRKPPTCPLPSGPGMGAPPDLEALTRYGTVRRVMR